MKAIVFVLRGCPAGWLGAYGNEWVGTPNLDRLAAEGVVFDRHISDQPDAAGACAAWCALPGGARLNDALRAASVRTVLIRANHPDTDAPEWFYAGWDEVFDARPQVADKSPLDALIRSLPGLLDRLDGSDFLLWVEIDRLLPPWDVRQDVFEAYIEDSDSEPVELEQDEDDDEQDEDEDEDAEAEPDDTGAQQSAVPVTAWADPPTGPFDASDFDALDWLHNSFATVVTTLDAELGTIFKQLRERRLDQSAALLVTSDFGYPLGEHGQIGPHRPRLHEELVHIPLVLRLPGAAEAGRRVAGFTQPTDIPATLAHLFGATATGGVSLLSLARGEAESTRTHAITRLELGDAAEAAIRTHEWALLLPVRVPEGETREPQLYAKPDDRWEVNDLRGRNIERADELETLLRSVEPRPAGERGG